MAAEDKSLVAAARQIMGFATGLTLKQKAWMAGGAVLVAATLFFFVRVMAKPDMKILYTGMESAEAQTLVARLEARDIAAKLTADGTGVSVPADQLSAARLETASQPMPQRGRMGFELFDKTNWASTDFDDKVNYQRALEGELERTIQTLDGVSSCRVHLALPPETIFTERERHAKATVVLHIRRGTLTGNTQMAITRLVAGAVDNLQPENVSVIDGETNRPLGGPGDSLLGDASGGRSTEEMLAQRLVKTLEPVVGEGRIRANVRVEFDGSTSEESQETYDPNAVVTLTSQKSEQRNGAGTPSGIPGTASNLAGTSKVVETSADQSMSKTENLTYGVNRTTRHTVRPAGQLKRVTAALLIDDDVKMQDEKGKKVEVRQKRAPEQMKQIEELAKAALAMDATRGDVLSVQNISFLAAPVEEVVRPGIKDKVRTIQNDWASSIRIGAVLLLFLFVYLVVLRPVKKQILISMKTPQITRATQGVDLQKPAAPALELADATPELKKVGNLAKHLNEKVKAEPAASTRLVQGWIRDSGVEG